MAQGENGAAWGKGMEKKRRAGGSGEGGCTCASAVAGRGGHCVLRSGDDRSASCPTLWRGGGPRCAADSGTADLRLGCSGSRSGGTVGGSVRLRAPHGVWIKSTIKRRATNTRSTATTAFTYPPEPGSGSSGTRARAASLSVGVAATSHAFPPAPRLSAVPPPVSASEAAAVRHLSALTHHVSQRSGLT